ncbi:MAG: LytR C-terminal domain-containing protein [Candidatus Daviesbacteria bacterium]|nr:MAG: LytR C-terminal domain-containing protein [Candidatus Daviesbacteria bacterium]
MTRSAHRRSWKATEQNRKLHQKTKLAIAILIILILSLLFGKIAIFLKSFQQPFSQEESTKNYTWNGKSNINLIITGKTLAVLTYKKVEQEIFLIKIPPHSYLNLPQNLGSWPLSSVYDLGQSLKPPQGSYLLKTSVSNLMGIPIDGFVGKENQTPVELLESLRQNPLKTLTLVPTLKTDLSLPELISLSTSLPQVRFDKVQTLDLEDLMIPAELPDGTLSLTGDSIKIDSLTNKLAEASFRKEGLTIAIYNGTSTVGLAGKAARMVTNLGGNVIILSSLEENQAKSGVYLSTADEKKLKLTETFKRLVQIFGLRATILPEELRSSRAQINVVLGEDFAQRF